MVKCKFLCLAVFAITTSACIAETGEQGSGDNNIIGGIEDTGDPAIIGLYARVPGAEGGALCTSELIAPNVLLTAAHCVAPSTVGEGAEFKAYLRHDFFAEDAKDPANWVKVKETHFDPAFDVNNLPGGHDIAVAILEQPITNITPIPFMREPLTQEHIGSPMRIVGYGLNDGVNQTGAGLKRQGTTELKDFDNLLVKVGALFQEPRICSGDSGGPAMIEINGVETIIGVASYGFPLCIAGSYSTRVDKYAAFIADYLP